MGIGWLIPVLELLNMDAGASDAPVIAIPVLYHHYQQQGQA